MRLKLKKLLAVTMAVATLSAFACNSSASSRSVNLSNYGIELDWQNITAGTHTGRIGVDSIMAYPTSVTPQLRVVMAATGGYYILDKTYSVRGSNTKTYVLVNATYIKVGAENVSTGNCTVNAKVIWDYIC